MDMECPYCDADVKIDHDDGFGYEEDVKHQIRCDNCDKVFVFETSISYDYEPEKANCLNDGNHKYRLSYTSPKEFSKMICFYCGEERELTNKERIEFNIGTIKSYFEKINK